MAETEIDEDAPLFAVTVAAELAEMHPQTLRQYDRLGLVVPGRTRGGSRRYSMRNIGQLREIAQLGQAGMNLSAITRILQLEDTVRHLTGQVNRLEQALREERENRPGARVFAAGATGSIITLRSGTRVRRETDIVLWSPRRGANTDAGRDHS